MKPTDRWALVPTDYAHGLTDAEVAWLVRLVRGVENEYAAARDTQSPHYLMAHGVVRKLGLADAEARKRVRGAA